VTCSCSSLRDTLERVKALLVCQETGKPATGYRPGGWRGDDRGPAVLCDCWLCDALRILEAGMSEAGKGER
jgi:hypothetical protein